MPDLRAGDSSEDTARVMCISLTERQIVLCITADFISCTELMIYARRWRWRGLSLSLCLSLHPHEPVGRVKRERGCQLHSLTDYYRCSSSSTASYILTTAGLRGQTIAPVPHKMGLVHVSLMKLWGRWREMALSHPLVLRIW